MNWELAICLTGLMLFSHWLNYIMGSPLDDNPRTREILFWLPYLLAVRRLKKSGALGKIKASHSHELEMTNDARTRRKLLDDQRLNVFLEGRDLFSWEKSLICPICFHWWLTVIVGAFLLTFDLLNTRADLLLAGFYYLVNHFIIRKIS